MLPAFVHGGLAWAAIALVAIPVLIHLWNRRRFRRIDWAAMEFLLQALRKNRRRIRLEGLILLLVRAALMALLAFFLARPLVSEKGLEWLGSAFRGEEKVFILDDSFSMSRRDGGRTAFQRATRALAAQVERLAAPGARDRLTVLRSSRPESPLLKGAILDRERAAALGQTLERLSPTDRRLALADVLAAIAASAGREESEGAARARAILIVTDLRAADWTDGRGGPDAALAGALERLAGGEEAGTRIGILDVGSEDQANVAITEAAVEGGDPIADIPAEIRAVVRNFGPSPAHALSLRVRYGPAPQPSEEGGAAATPGPVITTLAPGAGEELRIPCTFRKTGHYGLTLEVLGTLDALPGDDAFPLAVQVVPATRVLCVNGEPSSESFGGETDFLVEALAVPGEMPSGVEPDVVVEEGFPLRDLDRYAAVFLANWHAVPEEAAAALAGYAGRGGAVIIFAGDQLDPGLWNRRFASRPPAGAAAPAEPSTPFLPARLLAIEEAGSDPWRLTPAFDHPFFRELRAADGLLATARFTKRFALELLPGAQVLARFSDSAGSPAIVERAWGKGRVVLFASAADLEWSDWPRNPSYLMTLHELLRGLLASRSPRAPALAGSPLEVPCDLATQAPEARLRSAGYPEQPDRGLTASASPQGDPAAVAAEPAFRFAITDTDRAGLYALGLKAKTGETEWRQLAVRRDPLESDLARLAPARLRELYPGAGLEVVTEAAAFGSSGRGRFEASDLLLGLFAALLFAEAYLARRFAHHREAPPEGRKP